MRRRWTDAPWWALAVSAGLPFAVAMTLFSVHGGHGWLSSAAGGGIGGLFFGGYMGVVLRRQHDRQRQAVGELGPQVGRAARRASWRGPVPADPDVRAATLLLIEHQLGELERRRTLSLAVFGIFVPVYVVLAIVRSPWWAAAAVFFAAMLLMTLLLPRRLRRRADSVRAAAPQ
jgi:Flp pilus assembly protein TadB